MSVNICTCIALQWRLYCLSNLIQLYSGKQICEMRREDWAPEISRTPGAAGRHKLLVLAPQHFIHFIKERMNHALLRQHLVAMNSIDKQGFDRAWRMTEGQPITFTDCGAGMVWTPCYFTRGSTSHPTWGQLPGMIPCFKSGSGRFVVQQTLLCLQNKTRNDSCQSKSVKWI